MDFTEKDVALAIERNDVVWVAQVMDESHLLPGTEYPLPYSYDSWNLAAKLMAYASAAAMAGQLSQEMAYELMERTAKSVEVFELVRLVVNGMQIKADQWHNGISLQARSAIRCDEFDQEAAEEIEDLDGENFRALLVMIVSKEVRELNVNFTLPIVSYIYERELIPRAMLLAYMGLCLRHPVDGLTLQLSMPAREELMLEVSA